MKRDAEYVFLPQVKYPKFFMIVFIIIAIICLSFVRKEFGIIGIDSDDKLRFLQIRDYLRGQSWFDTDQYRMGLGAAGTDMHWSRLPDIPIILLTHIFDIFTSQDKALNLAISIWPPMSGAIVFAAFLIGAEHMRYEGNRKYLRIFIILLAGLFVLSNFRFRSGAIDHHNLQFGFVMMAMAAAMDPHMRFSRYFLSGLSTAIAVSIGPEVYLFIAAICGFMALNWTIKGQSATLGTQGFGIGLSLGVFIIFIGTVSPSNYTVIYCDALSLITLTAAVAGGLGLTIIAKLSHYFDPNHSFIRRFIALISLGGICLGVLSFQAPQCLSNPLNTLPPEVLKLWLGYVSEAQPLYVFKEDWPMFVPFVLGPVLVALFSLGHRYYEKYKTRSRMAELWDADALILLLMLTALGMTIYQIRFAPFVYIFTILPLGWWVTQSYQSGRMKGGTNVKYIAWLAVSLPIIWALPGSFFVEGDEAPTNAEQTELDDTDCVTDDIMNVFNSLPEGLIATNSNFTGPILMHTPHRVISGNYHRNWSGISTEIEISISPPDIAHELLIENKINYLYFCDSKTTKRFINYDSNGLMAKLKSKEIPDFLVPAITGTLAEGKAMIFKVVP